MKILFLLGMYHPRYSANGLCCKNVIDACLSKGWEVSCVVNSADGHTDPYVLDGATVYPVKPQLAVELHSYCDGHPTSALTPGVRRCAYGLNKLNLLFRSAKWPYVSPAHCNRVFKKAAALHEKEGFDAVVAVYTPMETLYAGYRLKERYPDITFIPYYLDALSGGTGPLIWSAQKKDKRQRQWEEKINQAANAVISMESARPYHESTPLSHPEKRLFLDVPMMLPPLRAAKESRQGKPSVALYAGSISYPLRNPIPLLEAFCASCDHHTAELWFAGSCNDPSIFQPYIEKSGGRIRLLGQKTHEEILALEQDADYLVNLGNTNPNMIPCKIFEYMRFGKPIISTYCIDNESSMACLKRYGCAYFLDERQSALLSGKELAAFLSGEKRADVPPDLCQSLFFQNTPQAFTNAIEQIVHSRKETHL